MRWFRGSSWCGRARRGPGPGAVLAGVALACPVAGAQVLRSQVDELVGIRVDERLGERVPAELAFHDADGRRVTFGDLYELGRPIVLVLAYFSCPVVCPTVLNQLVDDLNRVDFTAGESYTVVVVSFDPEEGSAAAFEAKQRVTRRYDRDLTPEVLAGWQFLVVSADGSGVTPETDSSARLAEAVGYRYRLLESGEYSHPMGTVFLTPDGVIARYIHGLTFPGRDQQFRLSLMEASEGRLVRTLGDWAAGFCWVYDPAAGAYTLEAMRVMQLGGVVSMAGVGGLIGVLMVRERLALRRRGDGGGGGPRGVGAGAGGPELSASMAGGGGA